MSLAYNLEKQQRAHSPSRLWRNCGVLRSKVSRFNGHAGRHGTNDQLSPEIDSLGLSAEGKKGLAPLVRR